MLTTNHCFRYQVLSLVGPEIALKNVTLFFQLKQMIKNSVG